MQTPDPYAREPHEVEIRFYAELNDFLPANSRQRAFGHVFAGTPSVKDTIEAIGVPHTEVDVILVDDESVGFSHRLRGGERVAVYPMFERYDISPLCRIRRRRSKDPSPVVEIVLAAPELRTPFLRAVIHRARDPL